MYSKINEIFIKDHNTLESAKVIVDLIIMLRKDKLYKKVETEQNEVGYSTIDIQDAESKSCIVVAYKPSDKTMSGYYHIDIAFSEDNRLIEIHFIIMYINGEQLIDYIKKVIDGRIGVRA